jgi:aryl carrier-like protein
LKTIKHALNRYARHTDGSVLIDVAASKVEDLYNDFDRNAPHIRRDLDQDLVDYLISCSGEVGEEPFTICFTFAKPSVEAVQARVRRSVNSFFIYMAAGEHQQLRQRLHRSTALFSLGLVILFFSVWSHRWTGDGRPVLVNMLAEGITVAAWVSLWESLVTFLFQWFPSHKAIKLYRRLAAAQVIFRSQAEATSSPGQGPAPGAEGTGR